MKTIKLSLVSIALVFSALQAYAVVRINGMGTYYTTIQEAVDAAQSGDQLNVATGTYAEMVTILSTNLTVKGGYDVDCVFYLGADLTTITPAGSSLVKVQDAAVTLDGLELAGSVKTRGIVAENTATVWCVSCRVHGNGTGGIRADASTITLDHSQVYDNNSIKGGGVCLTYGSQLITYDSQCVIMSNTAFEGGGVALDNSLLILQHDSDIHGNAAQLRGGGILLENSSTAIVTSLGTQVGHPNNSPNTATNGAGIFAADSFVIVSNYGRVSHNLAYADGGGVYLTNSMMYLTGGAKIGSTIENVSNQALGDGGGVCMIDSILVADDGAQVYNNDAGSGAGIYMDRGTIQFSGGAEVGDAATNMANRADDYGGGIFIWQEGAVVFADAYIRGNYSGLHGGGCDLRGESSLYAANTLFANNTAGRDGGAIHMWNNNFVLLDTVSIVSNSAGFDGGGIYSGSSSDLEIGSGSTISHNFAEGNGGGIAMYASITGILSDCELGHNTANKDGGAAYVYSGRLQCNNCDVENNVADGNGAGVWVGRSAEAEFVADYVNVLLHGNQALNGGAVYLDADACVSIIAPPPSVYGICYNTAVQSGGGIHAQSNSAIHIVGNVSFLNNSAENGGACCVLSASDCFMGTTNAFSAQFTGNTAAMDGGALYAAGAGTKIELHSVTIGKEGSGNVSGREIGNGGGGGVALFDSAEFTAINTRFEGNKCAHFGGGLYALNADVTIDSDFSSATSGALPPSVFIANTATSHVIVAAGVGGALYAGEESRVSISHAALVSNVSYSGGGAAVESASECTMINTLIAHNHAEGEGGGIWNILATNKLFNCTIAHNSPSGVDNATSSDTVIIWNSIVWGHTDFQVSAGKNVNFCDIQGGYAGISNINENPLFVNPSAYDYMLSLGSPCTDEGFPFASITNDCIGTARPYGDGWDMGAYEFVPEPSFFICYLLFVIRCLSGSRRIGY